MSGGLTLTAAQPRVSTASMTTSTVTSPPIVTPEEEEEVHPTIEEAECRGGLRAAAEVKVQEDIFLVHMYLTIYLYNPFDISIYRGFTKFGIKGL